MSTRWGNDQDEKSRQSVLKWDMESALHHALNGDFTRFAVLRELIRENGEFSPYLDGDIARQICNRFGVTAEQLKTWCIQYDALPKEPNL